MKAVVSAFAVAVALFAAAATNRFPRVKVPVAAPSSATVLARPAEPAAPTVSPRIEIPAVGAVDMSVLTASVSRVASASEWMALAVPSVSREVAESFSSADVARAFVAVSVCPSAIGIPAVFEVLVSSASKEELARILAEYAVRVTEMRLRPNMPASEVEAARKAWYETFQSRGGSRMWAICAKAKLYAEQGRDIEGLHKVFIETLQKWLERED